MNNQNLTMSSGGVLAGSPVLGVLGSRAESNFQSIGGHEV